MQSALRLPDSARWTKARAAEEVLRDAILEGRLQPEQRLILRDLQRELGLSVTPVREALKALVADGLVVDDPYRGMSVARRNINDAIEIYAIRSWLEANATELAARDLSEATLRTLVQANRRMGQELAAGNLRAVQLANRDFHFTLYAASNWKHLSDVIVQLWRRFPWGTLRTIPGRVEVALQEHDRILEALEARDPAAAAEAVRMHLQTAAEALKARFGDSDGVLRLHQLDAVDEL